MARAPDDPRAGFTLVEALAALVVMALFIAVVVPYAGRLVARWSIGQDQIGRADAWMQAAMRMSDDLAQALPLGVGPDGHVNAAFRGREDHIVFVRPALARPSALEIVAYAIRRKGEGTALVRVSRPFDPAGFAAEPPRGASVTLVEGNFRLRLVVIAPDGTRSRTWDPGALMPAAVELSIADDHPGAVPLAPIAMPISARVPAVAAASPQAP